LTVACGDGRVAVGEVCDDGNNIDGDGCAADCGSTEACGNGTIDSIHGEACDDGNLLDHDGCSSTCQVEVPHWTLHSLQPGLRSNAASAYDSRRHRIVVFGGQTSTPNLAIGDTLEWNGADWVHVATVGAPGARMTPAMAYDAARGVTVLFGGSS